MKPAVLLIVFVLFVSVSSSWAGRAEISACLKQVTPLKTQRDQVAELDGIWGLFQKTAELQDNSAEAVNLDKKINSILFHLDYLCNTTDGIPFDELADYVSTSLSEKGEEKFKKELIILGKNEAQIEVWFKFSKFAVANRYRVLDPQRISGTIQSTHPLIKKYLELAEKINGKIDKVSVLQETQDLTKQIDNFLEIDPYMSQAIHENSQIPYADWDENYGGS
jgi:hypothetical protein